MSIHPAPTVSNERDRGDRPADGAGPERRLAALDLDTHLRDPAKRQRFVTTLFDVVAPRYNRFTRLFSFGMDRRWKRTLLGWAADVAPNACVVDVACGTGDLACGVAARRPGACVVGVDVSGRMLARAHARRQHLRGARVHLAAGDALALPVRGGRAALVTVGYGLRNTPDLARALDEIRRALQPGGRLLILDFYRPRSRWWRVLFLGYLAAAGRLVGWLWHRQPKAYGYIAPSVAGYVSWDEMRATLERHGFTVERVRRYLGGGIAIHRARRAAAP